jgi:PAS domain S-box-containing protein
MSDTPEFTVLNVDDEDASRYATSRVLRQAGFEVLEAANGAEALRLVKENPDLVVLDVHLPDMDGFEVCERIKADPATALIPVLHLSAIHLDDQFVVKGLEGGADGYLTHPLEPPVLIAYVKALLRARQAEAKVVAAAREWRTTFDTISDAMCLVDREGKVLRCNEAMTKLMGRPFSEFIGRTCDELSHPILDSMGGSLLARLREIRHREVVELPMGERWLHVTVDPLLDEGGDFISAVHIIADVTERKRAEEALQESEERYRQLFEDSPISLWEQDFSAVKQRIEALRQQGVTDFRAFFEGHPEAVAECVALIKNTTMNKASLKLYAAGSKEELLAGLDRLIPPKAYHVFREELVWIAEGRTRFELESVNRTLAGERIDIRLHWSVAPGYEDTLSKVLVSIEDITERVRAEGALREAHEQLRATMNALPDLLFEVDRHGRILSFHAPRPELLYVLPEAFLGKTVKQVLPEEAASIITEAIEEAAETGRHAGAVYALEMPTGSHWFELSIAAKGDPATPDGRLVLLARDISERRRAEEKLQHSNVKLRRAFEGAVNVLVAAIEMGDPYTAGHQQRVTQLACAIAHEMGLPEEQIEGLHMAGLIHDLGKINVPSEILSRPGPLSDLQFGLVKMHAQTGHDVLEKMDFPWPVADIVLQHHERMDGSGYPQGLSGDDTLLEARILAVADVVEAMASSRPYRRALGLDKALEEIFQNRGILYDPEVVDACLKLFTEKRFVFE